MFYIMLTLHKTKLQKAYQQFFRFPKNFKVTNQHGTNIFEYPGRFSQNRQTDRKNDMQIILMVTNSIFIKQLHVIMHMAGDGKTYAINLSKSFQ